MRRILVCAIALALSPVSLAAGSVSSPSAASTVVLPDVTTQLPVGAWPQHYRVDVIPDVAARRFQAAVAIRIQVDQPLPALVLHALELEIGTSVLVDAAGKRHPLTVDIDAVNQTASFRTGAQIVPGIYQLDVAYSGRIGSQANGLFALDYATADGRRTALFTQFENSDARRFLPSWDEPNFKATFDVSLTVPSGQMAVGNMPVAKTEKLAGGRERVSFQTTPRMSTYLLFVAMGQFEREAITSPDGTEIGVITQTGKVDQARYAMEASEAVLREFNAYFGVAYPLPKLDNIAAPGRSQFFSAMENWGAIFTFEHTLLLDPAVSNVDDRQSVFSTAAHEIAHQWFGNLVTMAWWDDLWLNEGFATWMAARTVARLHPEWDIHGTTAAYSSRAAMGRDAYVTTHPVVQHVATVEQASQAFDAITYGKGGAVIGMLEDYVGADAWRDGVRRYIATHAYGNAVTDQLWEQIDKAAPGKHFMDVAHQFTLQPGVPLIRVSSQCVKGQTVVSLEQGEYSIDQPGKTPLAWRVPVKLRAGQGEAVTALVDGKARVSLPGCNAPVVINAGQKGYFRTHYAPEQFAALRKAFASLATVDQVGILMDVSSLALSGHQPDADLLDLLVAIQGDAATDVIELLASALSAMDGLYDGDPRQADFRRFAVSRLSPAQQRLGWDAQPGESAQEQQLRTRLISTLNGFGDPAVIGEARRRYSAFLVDPDSLSPELNRTVLEVVARHADATTWEQLRTLANKETTALVREKYFSLLGASKDAALAQKALDMALTDEPGATGGAALIGRVGYHHPALAFDFAVAHKADVDVRVDSTSRARFYPGLAGNSRDLALARRVTDFAQAHLAEGSRRDAQTVVGRIQTAARLREQRRPQIDAWLSASGF